MDTSAPNSLSPLDGRYQDKTRVLRDYFSESSLIFHRIRIEVLYLIALSEAKIVRPLKPKEQKLLHSFTIRHSSFAPKVKAFEAHTRHDVKAVEYYLRHQLDSTSLKDLTPYLHFCLTSEDINNLSYRLMVKHAQEQVILPQLHQILKHLSDFSHKYASLVILGRTHGQPAIPTTLGKEFSVFASRLLHQLNRLNQIRFTGKLNGAVGGYHSFHFARPDINWIKFSHSFITNLGLTPNPNTTQINPPDDLIDILHTFHHINSILIDLSQDTWRYISDDWLIQKKPPNIGSSTMPQKINPIEFENSEGNLTLANGLIETLNRKLPISRLQRDLSDSTLLRNLGVVFGHNLLAYTSLQSGLTSLSVNPSKINSELNSNWNILSEPLQIYLKTTGQAQAYEQVASKMKHQLITQKDWQQLTQNYQPQINQLTPDTYLGYSVKLTHQVVKQIHKYLSLYPSPPIATNPNT